MEFEEIEEIREIQAVVRWPESEEKHEEIMQTEWMIKIGRNRKANSNLLLRKLVQKLHIDIIG